MAFRLNRPFQIGKYARLRLNKESLGLTLGGKYARATLNTKGDLTGSVGGAGTGLYLQKKITVKNQDKNEKYEKNNITYDENTLFVDLKENSGFLLTNSIYEILNNTAKPTFDLRQTTNNFLEKIHLEPNNIKFQKSLINYTRYLIQDYFLSLKLKEIEEINYFELKINGKKYPAEDELKDFASLAGGVLSGLFNAAVYLTTTIAPLKFESQFPDRPYISSILKDKNSIFNYLDTEIKLDENDFINAIDNIYFLKEKWNQSHLFEYNLNNPLPKELKYQIEHFYDPASMLLPNINTKKYDIPKDVLLATKGFRSDLLIDIFVRVWSKATPRTMMKSKSYKILEKSFINDFSNSSLEEELHSRYVKYESNEKFQITGKDILFR